MHIAYLLYVYVYITYLLYIHTDMYYMCHIYHAYSVSVVHIYMYITYLLYIYTDMCHMCHVYVSCISCTSHIFLCLTHHTYDICCRYNGCCGAQICTANITFVMGETQTDLLCVMGDRYDMCYDTDMTCVICVTHMGAHTESKVICVHI